MRNHWECKFTTCLKVTYYCEMNTEEVPEFSKKTGMISRGAEHPLLKFLLILGGSAPLKLLHWLDFSESIGLASKVL